MSYNYERRPVPQGPFNLKMNALKLIQDKIIEANPILKGKNIDWKSFYIAVQRIPFNGPESNKGTISVTFRTISERNAKLYKMDAILKSETSQEVEFLYTAPDIMEVLESLGFSRYYHYDQFDEVKDKLNELFVDPYAARRNHGEERVKNGNFLNLQEPTRVLEHEKELDFMSVDGFLSFRNGISEPVVDEDGNELEFPSILLSHISTDSVIRFQRDPSLSYNDYVNSSDRVEELSEDEKREAGALNASNRDLSFTRDEMVNAYPTSPSTITSVSDSGYMESLDEAQLYGAQLYRYDSEGNTY